MGRSKDRKRGTRDLSPRKSSRSRRKKSRSRSRSRNKVEERRIPKLKVEGNGRTEILPSDRMSVLPPSLPPAVKLEVPVKSDKMQNSVASWNVVGDPSKPNREEGEEPEIINIPVKKSRLDRLKGWKPNLAYLSRPSETNTTKPPLTIEPQPVTVSVFIEETKKPPEIDPLDDFMLGIYQQHQTQPVDPAYDSARRFTFASHMPTAGSASSVNDDDSDGPSDITSAPYSLSAAERPKNFITLEEIMNMSNVQGKMGWESSDDEGGDDDDHQQAAVTRTAMVEDDTEPIITTKPKSQPEILDKSDGDMMDEDERVKRLVYEIFSSGTGDADTMARIESQVKASDLSQDKLDKIRMSTLTHTQAAAPKKRSLVSFASSSSSSSSLDGLPEIRKALFVFPPHLLRLSNDEVDELRVKDGLIVRGIRRYHNNTNDDDNDVNVCPPPISSWDEAAGCSERLLQVIDKRLKYSNLFPIQKQAIPAIFNGRDVIGIAKTGSGKTISFLIPVFRHVLDQKKDSDVRGPIAIILSPARELALQTYKCACEFYPAVSQSSIRIVALYGGAPIADQINHLKGGADVIIGTPGRIIDILGMQAGKLLAIGSGSCSLIVLDEADRMLDMGFEPQINAILACVRPDRQICMFSATFPRSVEKLARSLLFKPVQIIANQLNNGGGSGGLCASPDIHQFVEMRKEGDKFLRLLQILGIWAGNDEDDQFLSPEDRGLIDTVCRNPDDDKLSFSVRKVVIFMNKQEKCDEAYALLLRSGYSPSQVLSLHAGKDQYDRDQTIIDFKSMNLDFNILIATSVAGRGLDVPSTACVVNYDCPTCPEDYVHRVGRTGRGGRSGIAYTFIVGDPETLPNLYEDEKKLNDLKALGKPLFSLLASSSLSKEDSNEDLYAPMLIKLLSNCGQSDHVSASLTMMADKYLLKCKNGRAKLIDFFGSRSISQSSGKGFTFGGNERNQRQEYENFQRLEYDVSEGLVPDDEEDDDDDDEMLLLTDENTKIMGPDKSKQPFTLPTSISLHHTSSDTDNSMMPQSIEDADRMDRTRAMAASLGLAIPSSLDDVNPSLSIDTTPGSQQLSMQSKQLHQFVIQQQQQSVTGHFQDEFEINDLPVRIRQKLQSKPVVEGIAESIGAAVICRGVYVPPSKQSKERRLFLLIEGPTQQAINQAKTELLRVIQEETAKLTGSGILLTAAGGNLGFQSRYTIN